MSTIEQAAKRLEQLRQAGVEVTTGSADPDGRQAPSAASAAEPLPLRVAKELQARSVAPAAAEAAHEPDDAPNKASPGAMPQATSPAAPAHAAPGVSTVRPPSAWAHAEIDLARLSASGYITPQAPRSKLAEEFRVIKRPLLTNARGKPASPILNANRVMVTSSVAGEGKTYVSVNLAMSLAMELDTHVLLVDADTSRPAVLERLGLTPTRGLLDLLVEPSLPIDSVVLSTNVDRLSILPAGTPHGQATELLASDAMTRLVERLTARDSRMLVVFDAPPLLAASESRVLAAHMGQVIMVIAADDTPQGTVAEALSTVENCRS
jgi:exopolysaccharide/PEP-CTERM locus tyrosine autokinase